MRPEVPPPEPPVRDHRFDGIEEFDQRLPNWWLFTLYGTIVFSVIFWWIRMDPRLTAPDQVRVTAELARLEAARLAASSGPVTDDRLWQMSRNPVIVAAGRATFETTCASCHGLDLKGRIGPNLVDQIWLHGGAPTQIYATATNGVPAKGMPTWGPVLGAGRIAGAVAYILSYHQPGEPGMTPPPAGSGVKTAAMAPAPRAAMDWGNAPLPP
jgi:cytochrome c oxidase cbb3-type subunit 3